MADRIIAYCGLVCSECDAYKATQANDMAALAELAVRWSQEYGGSFKAEDCICDGCLGDGRKIGHCAECNVRACAVQHGVVNCAYCADFGCEIIEGFMNMAPPARATLEEIRRSLS